MILPSSSLSASSNLIGTLDQTFRVHASREQGQMRDIKNQDMFLQGSMVFSQAAAFLAMRFARLLEF